MATESTFVQPAVPKFDGHYNHWAMLMENFLRSKEYWGVVENGVPAAADEVTLTDAQKKIHEEQKLKDLKAKNYLFQALDRSILETIINKDTSKNIWDSMKQKYQGTTRVKRAHLQALRKEYEMLHMKEGECVNEYVARVLVITNKMKANGEDLRDFSIVEKILRSMTSKFNYVVCSIEESKDTSTLSIDELQSSLLVHKQRMSNTVEEEHALKITHGESQAENQEHILLMAEVDGKEQRKTDVWFLDSGCSNHMCGKIEYFSDFDDKFTESVKLGNDTNMVVNGKGNIKLEVEGVVSIISGVFYVPELKNNLLSLGQLQEKGLTILFQQRQCKIYHPDKGLIMKANMSANRMFVLHAISLPIAPTCFNTTTKDATHMWHCSPTLAVKDKTPEEAWSGVKPEESKAYKLYDPISQRIIVSRDVIFEENEKWEWEKQHEADILCDLEWEDDVVEEPRGEGNDVDAQILASPTINQETSNDSVERRTRRPPTWLQDYVTEEGLSDEEVMFFAMYAAVADPPNYDEAVKSTVKLEHCNTLEQIADVMTKPLKMDAFLKLREKLGICAEHDVN
ncbi:hypothetical protein HRI_000294200 [Hibiscus trionum]|uniref:Retrovirus-related Pol polyprotein from transposon TNT 1-94 n=1 Tax=Hibiscus trionum TaxID=183268 RepID=A0A9W7GV97_HIBTR|nr:hypothetical protein HRI_000294200 [Hibiscus trionum]